MFPSQTSPGPAILQLEVNDHTSPSVTGQEQNGTRHTPGALPSGPALPAALLGNLFVPWGVAKRAFLRNHGKEAFGGAPEPHHQTHRSSWPLGGRQLLSKQRWF